MLPRMLKFKRFQAKKEACIVKPSFWTGSKPMEAN